MPINDSCYFFHVASMFISWPLVNGDLERKGKERTRSEVRGGREAEGTTARTGGA